MSAAYLGKSAEYLGSIGECPDSMWRVSRKYLQSIWGVFENVLRILEEYLESVCRVSREFLSSIWRVSGVCLHRSRKEQFQE